MSLAPGTRLGAYEIAGLIGAGGMGEVYRAHDTKLDRDVAIKVLPPSFTGDLTRLARFEREARMLAALNHPHIGAIYGLEESNDVKALVLELIEGPTPADRVAARNKTPVTEFVSYPLAILALKSKKASKCWPYFCLVRKRGFEPRWDCSH